jgi:hypothetical protein
MAALSYGWLPVRVGAVVTKTLNPIPVPVYYAPYSTPHLHFFTFSLFMIYYFQIIAKFSPLKNILVIHSLGNSAIEHLKNTGLKYLVKAG